MPSNQTTEIPKTLIPKNEEPKKRFLISFLTQILSSIINKCECGINYLNRNHFDTPMVQVIESGNTVSAIPLVIHADEMPLQYAPLPIEFNLSQIEVVILFWCLQNAGITDFYKQANFAEFLESSCKSYKVGKFVEIKNVKIALSKMRAKLPTRKTQKFYYDKEKDHLITEIEKGLDFLKEKITLIKDDLNMPAPIEQDKLKKG